MKYTLILSIWLLLHCSAAAGGVCEMPLKDTPVNRVYREIALGEIKPMGWLLDGVAHQPVTDRTGLYNGEVSDEVEKITLVPHGCTKVRIVAFPVVR